MHVPVQVLNYNIVCIFIRRPSWVKSGGISSRTTLKKNDFLKCEGPQGFARVDEPPSTIEINCEVSTHLRRFLERGGGLSLLCLLGNHGDSQV